jgi:hypothetical protein
MFESPPVQVQNTDQEHLTIVHAAAGRVKIIGGVARAEIFAAV